MAERIEGSGGSQLLQLIQTFGYNKDLDLVFGTVTSDAPNLKIKVDNMKVELDKADLMIAEHLTIHSRKVTFMSIGKTNIKGTGNVSGGSVQDSMTSAGYTPHTHDITSFGLTGTTVELKDGNFMVSEGEIRFMNELTKGERVALVEIAGTQMYFVIDRVVQY
jgi:hypothetical protein